MSSPLPTAPWTAPYITLPIHAVISHQMQLALDGVESSIIIGPRGSGKTSYLSRAIDAIRRDELLRERTGGDRAREILYYMTGAAIGSKTVLTDVYTQLTGQAMGKRSKQDWTPTAFIGQIVMRAAQDNVRVIVIDEAQLINAANIDHLRQLCDKADQDGHGLRLILVGNEELRQAVAQTGQLGERFATEVRVPPLTSNHIKPYFVQLHPDLPGIKEAEPAKTWEKFENELYLKVQGSYRRLMICLANAHQFARRQNRAMTLQDLRQALDKLADDV